MTKEYIVKIEMPDGDDVSSIYLRDIIQADFNVEDKGRWKVSVKEKQCIDKDTTNEEKANEIANGICTHICLADCSAESYFSSENDCYKAAMAMAQWKDEQLADYLQQSWQRYKAAPTPTASAKRHLIERMANDLGVRLKFNNPYIE